MKRLNPIAFAVLLTFSLAVAGLAQEAKTTAEKKQTSEKQQTPPATQTEHKTMMEHKTAMSATEKVMLNKEEITSLQNALIKAKAYKGKATGTLDMATKDAIRNYQKTNKLKVTGEPNHETLQKLGVSYTAPTVKSTTQPMEHHQTDMKQATEQKSHSEPKKPQ